MDWLWGIEKLSPALVGFLGAWLGSRWGVTKFRREKYWESKIKTYETILNGFESIAYWGKTEGAEAYCAVTVGSKDINSQHFHQSMRQLAQLEVTSAVYLSADFRSLMHKSRYEMESLYVITIEDLRGEDAQTVFYGAASLASNISEIAYKALDSLNAQASKDYGMANCAFVNYLIERKKVIDKDWLAFRSGLN